MNEFWFEEGCFITELSNTPDDPAVSVARARVPVGVVLIPSSCRQRIANIGDKDLIFLAICTPRFRQEAYQDAERSAG